MLALYLRVGMGLLCPGAAAVFAGLVLVALVRELPRNPLTREKVSLAVVAILAAAGTGYAYYATTPAVLMRDYVVNPVPDSVRILHSHYEGGRDPGAFLHFQLDPAAAEQILKARPYVSKPDLTPPHGRPEWWKPESMGKAEAFYWHSAPDSPADGIVWLWLNESRTEAYLAHWTL